MEIIPVLVLIRLFVFYELHSSFLCFQVCVESCPNHPWTADPYIKGEKAFDLNDVRNNLICFNDKMKNSVTDSQKLKNATDSNLCARWFTQSYPCKYFISKLFQVVRDFSELFKASLFVSK